MQDEHQGSQQKDADYHYKELQQRKAGLPGG